MLIYICPSSTASNSLDVSYSFQMSDLVQKKKTFMKVYDFITSAADTWPKHGNLATSKDFNGQFNGQQLPNSAKCCSINSHEETGHLKTKVLNFREKSNYTQYLISEI